MTESNGSAALRRGAAQRSRWISGDQLIDLLKRHWLTAFASAFAFRLWYCWWRQLVPDEAVYWAWSRHLDLSYFDHPPMVAYLIRVSTSIFGSTELGVRFGTATLAFAAVIVLIAISRKLFDDPRTTALVALIWLTSPLLAGLATLSTPDTPALFFSICAMAIAVQIARGTGGPPVSSDLHQDQHHGRADRATGLWLIFGFFCGLALLSKYTTILLPGSVFLALLFSKSGRVHLRRPGIYLAAIVALIVFSPVIVWNQRHDWASFRFQLAHGLESQDRSGLRMFSEWLGGQALIFTPVLFVLTIFVLGKFWRDYRKLDLQQRLLLWCASIPLLFFGYSGFRSRGEPNWPAFAYFPASLLLAKYVSERWQGARWNWTMIGCIVAFGGFLAVQFPEPFWMMKIPWVKKMDELVGWRDFGRQIDAVARGAPVIANRHQDAGEAAFYMNGQPDVWASSVGSRPTAFDYMRGGPDISSLPRVLFLGSHDEEFVRKYGFIPGATGRFTIILPSARTRSREWTMMERAVSSPSPSTLGEGRGDGLVFNVQRSTSNVQRPTKNAPEADR